MRLLLFASLRAAAAASTETFLYEWREPIRREWHGQRHVRIRGLMNTGTNFLRTLLDKVPALQVSEERKHMYPWVLERRHAAAPPRSVGLVMVRHPLSWITGMRKAPYFLKCDGARPADACWMRLVFKSCDSPTDLQYRRCQQRGQLAREQIDIKYESIVEVWNAYYSGYLEWKVPFALVRYEDLLLDADRTLKLLFPQLPAGKHLHTDGRAKEHGASRSFADARAYNLNKKWRGDKFSEQEVAAHCGYANRTLLGVLGYTCP